MRFMGLAIVGCVLLAASPARGGVTFVGSGITVVTSNGPILGSSTIFGIGGWCSNGMGICHPYDWRYRLMFRKDGSWYWFGPTYNGTPLIEAVRREDPALYEAIVGPTMPDPDPGMVALREGRYEAAANEFLRAHARRVREEDAESAEGGVPIPDRSMLRLHALALAAGGEFARAAEAFGTAHREDPALGADPIDGARVLASGSEVRRIVLDAMQFAKRADSADAWAMVGYLKQVQGEHDEARSLVAKAESMRNPPAIVP